MLDLRGVQLVTDEHFNVSDVSVTAQLARVKASGAHVTFVHVTGTALGTVLRNAYDLGFGLPVMTDSGNIDYTHVQQLSVLVARNACAGAVRDAQQ